MGLVEPAKLTVPTHLTPMMYTVRMIIIFKRQMDIADLDNRQKLQCARKRIVICHDDQASLGVEIQSVELPTELSLWNVNPNQSLRGARSNVAEIEKRN